MSVPRQPAQTPAPTVPDIANTSSASNDRTWLAVLTLYVFAALIPESIASANTPTYAWVLNPALALIETAFYGSANLVIRELRVRRSLGWTSVLLLGAAFGFANEGIIAVTWFRVLPTDGYIFQNGVNWAWAVALTIFHAVFSVVVPIAFVELLFPRIAARPWLSRSGTLVFAVLFALVTSIGFFPPRYRVNQLPVLAGMIALVIVALLLPRLKSRTPSTRRTPRPWTLRICGFLGAFLYFLAIYGVPNIFGRHADEQTLRGLQALYIVILLALFALCLAVVRRWTARADWGVEQTLALITGSLVPSLLTTLLVPTLFAQLQPLLTVPFFLWLVWLAHRVAKHPRTAAR